MEFDLNRYFTNDQLQFLAWYGVFSIGYLLIKFSSNLKVDDLMPRGHRYSEFTDSSDEEVSEEIIINESSESSESSSEEHDDPSDTSYVQPNNYTSKLRKKQKLI
uniref:Uncharacterized protein n=1 Tax=viral metagenome TaxID=1070528 RepID=A0A6C0AZS2_9ZZZZ